MWVAEPSLTLSKIFSSESTTGREDVITMTPLPSPERRVKKFKCPGG